MKSKLRSLLIITSGLLTGCSLIPDYIRPEAPIPAEWPTGPAYKNIQADVTSPIASDIPWRKFFSDQRLQKIIETALTNNRDLRLAALNVERARAMYRIQGAELLPTINAVGNGAKERVSADVSSTGVAGTVEQYRANLELNSWEIDFFGRIRSLEEAALQEYLATEEARRGAQILLISEVASSYLTLAANRERLELAQLTLESQQAAYNLIKRRFEVGLATELDLRQVQTSVDSARVDVARLTGQVAQDENALNLLAGAPVPADLLPLTLSAGTVIPDVAPGTSSEVLLSRPDIAQAENMLKAANANIGAARATLFPRITITTSVGTATGELSNLFQSGTDAWKFASNVSLPIFDARAWLALRVTKVDQQIAQAQYERTIQVAFKEVADALAQKANLGAQYDAQLSLVNATAETYRLANARYNKGVDIFLNVLVAQRSLYAAQQGLVLIRLAQIANQVQLYAILGGGGDVSDPLQN